MLRNLMDSCCSRTTTSARCFRFLSIFRPGRLLFFWKPVEIQINTVFLTIDILEDIPERLGGLFLESSHGFLGRKQHLRAEFLVSFVNLLPLAAITIY